MLLAVEGLCKRFGGFLAVTPVPAKDGVTT
jgi:hypothetical protein